MQVMDRKTIMVSSTVYGVEDLLESIYDMLDDEYNVVMSHKGTVTNSSANSCYMDCEEAVRKCDIFLGILTPSYGSGITKIEPCYSITHKEMLLAKQLNKKRFFLVNEKITFADNFLKEMGLEIDMLTAEQKRMKTFISSLSVIQMYRDILQKNSPPDYHIDSYSRFAEAEVKIQRWFISPDSSRN